MNAPELIRITKTIMMIMEDNGILIDNHEKMKTFIFHAFNDDRIKFFMKDFKVAGFVMWEAIEFGDGYDIYIAQMVVLPEFRGLNIYEEMKSIKYRYGKIYKVSWHRRVNDEMIKKVRYLEKELIHGTT